MKKTVARTFRKDNTARNAWCVVGGLLALGIIAITVRELPSIRREIRLLKM
jgi:hypothetical protein